MRKRSITGKVSFSGLPLPFFHLRSAPAQTWNFSTGFDKKQKTDASARKLALGMPPQQLLGPKL